MILGVALPVLVLGAAGAAMPYLWSAALPEGAGWLVANGVLSALCLVGVGALWFFFAYLARETTLLTALAVTPMSGLRHFATLGLASVLIWGAPMLLALSVQPRRWKEKVW
ncbi:hypothetical protein DXV76_08775 [Rhodobacteraceae bacterium CCMM004]|nr:hypothetical protein DXV76_08775 [Rhodobacteraceae bacterium CCMM004]